jgi:hypothetical protein
MTQNQSRKQQMQKPNKVKLQDKYWDDIQYWRYLNCTIKFINFDDVYIAKSRLVLNR